jgi:hypothetical protein
LEAGTDTNIRQKLFLHKILSKSIINGVKLERKSRGEKNSNKSEEVYIGSNNEVRSKRIDLCVFFVLCESSVSKRRDGQEDKKQRETELGMHAVKAWQ